MGQEGKYASRHMERKRPRKQPYIEMIRGETKTSSSSRGYQVTEGKIQGKAILVRVSARFELARVRVIGSQL